MVWKKFIFLCMKQQRPSQSSYLFCRTKPNTVCLKKKYSYQEDELWLKNKRGTVAQFSSYCWVMINYFLDIRIATADGLLIKQLGILWPKQKLRVGVELECIDALGEIRGMLFAILVKE